MFSCLKNAYFLQDPANSLVNLPVEEAVELLHMADRHSSPTCGQRSGTNQSQETQASPGARGGEGGGERRILPLLNIKELNLNFVTLILQDIGVAGRTYPEKAFLGHFIGCRFLQG